MVWCAPDVRQLSASVHKDNESYLNGDQDSNDYADHLSYRGGALIGNLQGHHGWEDHSYSQGCRRLTHVLMPD
jgi:hypothetical protein